MITKSGQDFSLLVLSRKLISGFNFAYVPWGPEIECTPLELCDLAKQLKTILPRNTIFIRFDLPWVNKFDLTQSQGLLANQGTKKRLKKSNVDVQAPNTVIIDLTKSCDEILANMKSKWRYNISLSKKKGVEVQTFVSSNENAINVFYNLMEETAKRDSIFIHSIDYYKTLFEICDNDPYSELRLYTALHGGETLAAIIVLFYGDTATYLYGASSNNKRNLMAPYALQWQAIQDAKEKGCRYYDLFGIPPNDDPNHPMAGLYRFKTGFGGEIINRLGCYDYAYKPVLYFLFTILETIRKKIMNRKKR